MSEKVKTTENEDGGDFLKSDFFYYLPISTESQILEIGCGMGSSDFKFAGLPGEITHYNKSFNPKSYKEAFDIILVPDFSYLFLGEDQITLSQLYSWLKPQGVLCFGTQTLWGYWRVRYFKKKFKLAGFSKETTDYIAYPNNLKPRFLIPREDDLAFIFIIQSMTGYRRIWGSIARLLVRVPFFVCLFKNFFCSYFIFIEK